MNNYGYISFGPDGLFHWTEKTPPSDHVEVTAATQWEKFLFNSCGNRSDKILVVLGPVL